MEQLRHEIMNLKKQRERFQIQESRPQALQVNIIPFIEEKPDFPKLISYEAFNSYFETLSQDNQQDVA